MRTLGIGSEDGAKNPSSQSQGHTVRQRIEEGPMFKLPMWYRHFRGVDWEVLDDNDIVWALTWSER